MGVKLGLSLTEEPKLGVFKNTVLRKKMAEQVMEKIAY
jgi:hypothetical protein